MVALLFGAIALWFNLHRPLHKESFPRGVFRVDDVANTDASTVRDANAAQHETMLATAKLQIFMACKGSTAILRCQWLAGWRWEAGMG